MSANGLTMGGKCQNCGMMNDKSLFSDISPFET
jgi:hypothetical protein